jgi:hypothetical protein
MGSVHPNSLFSCGTPSTDSSSLYGSFNDGPVLFVL